MDWDSGLFFGSVVWGVESDLSPWLWRSRIYHETWDGKVGLTQWTESTQDFSVGGLTLDRGLGYLDAVQVWRENQKVRVTGQSQGSLYRCREREPCSYESVSWCKALWVWGKMEVDGGRIVSAVGNTRTKWAPLQDRLLKLQSFLASRGTQNRGVHEEEKSRLHQLQPTNLTTRWSGRKVDCRKRRQPWSPPLNKREGCFD